MKRRDFLKFGSAGIAGLAAGGFTRTPIFRIGNALACRRSAFKFAVYGDTQWTRHQLDSATGLSDLSIDPAGSNPYSVAGSIIDQIDAQCVKHGVDFVIQVGDLTDCGTTRAIQARALMAQTNLIGKGIDFFPIRGNHETYGPGYGESSNTDSSVTAMKDAFPQMLGNQVVSAAENFSLASDSVAADCLTYAFDFGNARFIMLDTWCTGTKNVSAAGYNYGYTVNDQQDWLSAQLTHRHPAHAFVFAHQPLMAEDHQDTMFNGYSNANQDWQNAFYASMHDNGARYFISGHDHIHQRSLVKSPDGASVVEELICASCSNKFYTPRSLADANWFSQKGRETSISQEMFTVGFYIFTVDGPVVTVDYYSDDQGNWWSDGAYPGGGTGTLITPTFNFVKKETWGYSVSPWGIATFELINNDPNHAGYQLRFGVTTAKILKQGGTAQDYTGRYLTKNVEAWWAHRNWVGNSRRASEVLTLVGAASGAIEQDHVSSNTCDPNDPVGIVMTYASLLRDHHSVTLCTLDECGKWVNAVDKNFGGTKQFISGPYKSSYALGSYGFDAKTRTAWAVVNHDSDFAVIRTQG